MKMDYGKIKEMTKQNENKIKRYISKVLYVW